MIIDYCIKCKRNVNVLGDDTYYYCPHCGDKLGRFEKTLKDYNIKE